MVLQGGQDAFCEGGDGLVDEIAIGAEVALEADAEVFSLGVIAGKCANDGMTVIAGEGRDEAVAPVDRDVYCLILLPPLLRQVQVTNPLQSFANCRESEDRYTY